MFFSYVFHPQNVLCLIFHKKLLPVNMELLLTAKIAPDVNNYPLLVHAVQEMGSSLHVRHSFCCMIMASTKLK